MPMPSPLPTTAAGREEAARLQVLTGQRYLRMDRPEDAEAAFHNALLLDPQCKEAREALDALHRDYPSSSPAAAPLPDR